MIKILAVAGESEPLRFLTADDVPGWLDKPGAMLWIDLSGPVDEAGLSLLRDVFRFHPLTIKDCFESRENPKAEEFDDYVYVITHGLTPGSTAEESEVVELDVFLSHRYLVTYHEAPSRSVAHVTDLIERGGGSLLRRGPAHVLSLILGQQVDGIEPVLDQIESRIDELEERVLVRAVGHDLGTLLALKRTTLQMRRWMSKQRDVVYRLARDNLPVVPAHEALQFRDVHHHLQQFTDSLENFREALSSLQGTYLNVTNLRLSEIMKFLTVFTAILMPLTVITGVYGMNFENMPELRTRHGYYIVLATMAVTAAIILIVFKRRGWLERTRPRPEEASGGIRRPTP